VRDAAISFRIFHLESSADPNIFIDIDFAHEMVLRYSPLTSRRTIGIDILSLISSVNGDAEILLSLIRFN
jgi:hypothetical protein